MDVELSNSVKRNRRNLVILKLALSILFFVGLVALLRFFIRPSINRDEFTTAFIEIGNIEASITASGKVFPEFEETKISPVQSRIMNIYKSVGERVVNGDSILTLDKKITRSSLEKLRNELNIKKNNVDQLRLQLEKSLIDLKTQYEIKIIQVEYLETELEGIKYLNKIGGGTKADIKMAELDLKISQLELEQINQSIQNQEKIIKSNLLGLNYEINIQQKNVDELRDKLDQSTVTCDKDGVITWINDQIGTNINAGDELVKIANLKSYEVTGSIPDMHANKLNAGGQVIIRLNEHTDIRGEIESISPSVSGNIIQFKIKLEEKNNEFLRPNMTVNVFVITAFRKNVARVSNGTFYKGTTKQMVFVADGNKLIRKEVEFGESNSDFVEIVSGLANDDEMVNSDMSDYERHKQLSVSFN